MANAAELIVKIVTDASGAQAGISATTSKLSRLQSGARKMLPAAAAVAGGLAIVGTKAVQSASELEQAQGAVESIYGKSAAAVDKYAQTSVDRLGLSEAAYKNYSALVGAALQNAGFSAQEAAGMSDKAMVRAADMAATFGGSTSDAIDAINAAVSRAEFDPLEKYGISLNKTAINAELAKRGQDDLTGAALKNAEAQATLDLIYGNTAKAAGQFARESDTVAGQQARATASIENAAATIGTALLPAVAAVAEKLAEMATWVGENSTLVLTLAGVLAGVAAAIFAVNAAFAVVNAAMKVYRATVIVVTAVTKLFGIAAKSTWRSVLGPIGLVVAAIGVVIAIVMVLWNKFPPFRNAVMAVWRAIANAAKATWQGIKSVVSSVVGWAKGFIKGFGQVVKAVWRGIKTAGAAAWRGVRAVISSVVGWAKGFLRGFGNVVKAVWRGIKAVASTVWRGIRSVISGVVSGIKSLLRGMKSVIDGVWRGIKSTASTVWNAIRSVVSNTVNAIKRILTGVKSVASNVWNAIKNAAKTAFNAILGPINAVKSAIDKVISAVKSAISWIGKIKIPDIPFSKLNPFSAVAPAPAAPSYATRTFRAAPTLAGRASGLGAAGGGGGIVINVSGTLNDVDTANAIRRVLRNDQRRRNGVTIDRTRQGFVN